MGKTKQRQRKKKSTNGILIKTLIEKAKKEKFKAKFHK